MLSNALSLDRLFHGDFQMVAHEISKIVASMHLKQLITAANLQPKGELQIHETMFLLKQFTIAILTGDKRNDN